jgi:hypothetical protein
MYHTFCRHISTKQISRWRILTRQWLQFVNHRYQFSLQCICFSKYDLMVIWMCCYMAVKLSLCLSITPWWWMGESGIVPCTHNLTTRWQAPTTSHLMKREPWHPLDSRQGGTKGQSAHGVKDKYLCPCQSPQPVTILPELPPIHIHLYNCLLFTVSPVWSASWYRQGGKHY